MKLWHLRPVQPDSKLWDSYDITLALIVRAATEREARLLASDSTEGETTKLWLDPEKTFCERLTAKGEPGVILVDFLAG